MKYVALLRGINVGGNNKVPMERLRKCFEKAGFKNVSTYINSGNVIFETNLKSTESIAAKIERIIVNDFGFPVRVVVRSANNIKKVASAIPKSWQNDSEQKSDVLFLWDNYANKKSLSLIETKAGIDNVSYIDGTILWNVDRKQYGKSGMNKFVGTELYKNMTARNVNTVRKLSEMV